MGRNYDGRASGLLAAHNLELLRQATCPYEQGTCELASGFQLPCMDNGEPMHAAPPGIVQNPSKFGLVRGEAGIHWEPVMSQR